ncbi:hypothetical protein BGZ70_006103, partial [Mortierella alpina]
MTTSSRMEHQPSVYPGYPHQHPLQDSLHPHHPFSVSSSEAKLLPPLAYLSEAAAAVSAATTGKDGRLDFGHSAAGTPSYVKTQASEPDSPNKFSLQNSAHARHHAAAAAALPSPDKSHDHHGGDCVASGRSSPHR